MNQLHSLSVLSEEQADAASRVHAPSDSHDIYLGVRDCSTFC